MNSRPTAAGACSYKNSAEQLHHARHRARTPTETRPELRSWPQTGTRFSIPSCPVHARSRQRRSDNHRSRNHVAAREPMTKIPHGQKDPGKKPDALHLTRVPSDQHLEQLPPVKRIFGYFFCNRKKSLASASEAGGETAFEVEFDLIAAAPGLGAPITTGQKSKVEIKSRTHPGRNPCPAASTSSRNYLYSDSSHSSIVRKHCASPPAGRPGRSDKFQA